MYKKVVLVLCGYLLPYAGSAQVPSAAGRFLQEIEQNNPELKAQAALLESRQLALKGANNLPDPEAIAFYLPWGDHRGGDYTEFQLSQSLEFPSVYASRGRLLDQQQEQLALEYAFRRQEILLQALHYYQELIYMNKRMALEQLRVQQAQRVYEQVQVLFDSEQLGILEMNKAKISWLQDQYRADQLAQERQNLRLSLSSLNGGKPLGEGPATFEGSLVLQAPDTLWQQKLATDPRLNILQQQEAVARQQIRLARQQALPNLTLGVNRQGVQQAYYSGLYGGASIPLWNNRHKVRAAEAQFQQQQAFSGARLLGYRTAFENQYGNYQLLQRTFLEYQNTLSSLNSDALLLQAYELGQISFMEYYMELQFYRQAQNAMLEMEKELHQQKALLLQHQL
jgi:outer membrane protein, heavy metal efflux system